jgi:phosphoserine aminotransferase
MDGTYGKIDGHETYEWALSDPSDPEIIITPSAKSEDFVSEFKQARKGSRELLLEKMNYMMLLVWNAALDGVTRCTCKAAASFDSQIMSKSAWSETTAQSVDRPCTSPKVAVGLSNGTVHFMELRIEVEANMH